MRGLIHGGTYRFAAGYKAMTFFLEAAAFQIQKWIFKNGNKTFAPISFAARKIKGLTHLLSLHEASLRLWAPELYLSL